MANVKMEELARVQTVGPGGIGVYPPVPTEKVDKVSSAGLGKEELQRSANVLPHPGAVDDGAVMQEIDGVWSGGQGGGGSADIDLGVTDASVGDYLKVKSVDEDGKPTAWESEPVDTETIVEATDAWLEENVAQETGYVLDNTLTMSNAAAPADKVGELKTALIYNDQPTFVKGMINGTTGEDGSANNFARSGYIYVDRAVDVYIDHDNHPEYRIYVYVYNADKVYQSNSGMSYQYSLTNFTGYIRVALRNTTISDLTTSDIDTLKAALHIEMNNAVPSIEKLYDKTAENKNYIDSLVHYKVRTEIPYNLLTNVNFTANKYIDKDTGELKSNTGDYSSDYIPIDPSYGYICKNTNVYNYYYDAANDNYHQTYDNSFVRYQFAFYDINKVYIQYTGAGRETSIAIPENAAYFRITLDKNTINTARLVYGNEANKPNIRQVEPQLKPTDNYYYHPITGYENLKMVMFGDSLTHGDLFIDNDGISYVDYAGDYLGTRLLNVGFGGTRMALAPNQTLSGAYLFSFYNLCQVIVSDAEDKWDDLDDYATNTNTTYLPHLNRLKAIDWNTVHAIGIMYGANDFASNTPIGTGYNVDYHNFDGACAYGLNLLLTKYPHLQVILFSPTYKQITAGTVETDTDNAPNAVDLYMYQYGDALKNVSEVVHCPVIDMYHCVGINKYNRKLLMPDGTHPRTTLACKRMGRLFAEQIKQYVFPLI